jgi:hypothetical protein
MGNGPKFTMGEKKVTKHEKEGLGPGAYVIKSQSNLPNYSFGMNLASDITSKNHVKHVKKDGPGPGSHDNKDV